MRELIAIVDDEEDIVELVSVHLKKNKYRTMEFYDAKSFMDSIKMQKPDLIILDLMLPDMDGIDICKYIKSHKDYKKIPVIMLTAKQDEMDKVIGLEIGADDYMTKPFSTRELIARVKAVLRRWEDIIPTKDDEKILKIDNLITIDLQRHEVFDKDNNKIILTTTEFNLLVILTEKRGWVFSREKLLNNLWGEEKYVIDRTIDVHIKNLREKLGRAGRLIKNIRGVGYKLDNQE